MTDNQTEIEGLRKYKLEHLKLDLEELSKVAVKIESIRKKLYSRKYIGTDNTGQSYGNISMKLSNSNIFVISSTQTGFKTTTSLNDYSLIFDYDLEQFTTKAFGLKEPSSETLTHACVYDCDNSISAIIHIHDFRLWEKMINSCCHNVTAEVPYGTAEMTIETRKIVNDRNRKDQNDIFAMAGHHGGIVSYGCNLNDAYDNIISIEKKYND